jgi:hypothetical protein
MKTPYTDAPLDAFLIAQSCAGAVLSAVLWHKPIRSAWVTVPLFLAIWLCVLSPLLPPLAAAFTTFTLSSGMYLKVLGMAAFLGTLTAALSMRWWLLVFALLGQAVLFRISHYVMDSDNELAVLHLAWLGALIGMGQPRTEPLRTEPLQPHDDRHVRDDGWIALIVFGLALVVCVVVLQRGCDSDDEWSYTWQSIVFAHGRAYLPAAPCGDALRNFWVFFNEGRAFSQYTPGWPGFMTPFALLRVPWLAGPVAHALLAVGVARLSRRVVAAETNGLLFASPRQIRAAGFLGALVATTGAAPLLNGASRYSHIFVAALFAWCLELAASLSFDGPDRKERSERAILLGICAAWLLATRPGDGASLGTGIFFLFSWGIARGRIGWKLLLATAFGFAAIAALTLVILRLQLGAWFKTGYSVAVSYYPWAQPKFSLPKPYQFKIGFPLVTTAYCFWPASVPLGVAGLFRARGSARPIVAALAMGTAALLGMYMMSEFGRSDDFGYGNRFQIPTLVALSVGAALLLAPLFAVVPHGSARSAFGRKLPGGPAAVAAFAMLTGALRIAPLIYAPARLDVSKYLRVEQAVERQDIHDAVVISSPAETGFQALDVTRNWPIPDPDVIIAGETLPTDAKCLREHFPDRHFYRAHGFGMEVVLEPL